MKSAVVGGGEGGHTGEVAVAGEGEIPEEELAKDHQSGEGVVVVAWGLWDSMGRC